EPPIPGIKGKSVISAVEAFSDASLIKGKCVILGAGTTGLELAIYLASLGKEVRILEKRGSDEAASAAATYAGQLAKYGLAVEYGSEAVEILPDSVKIRAEGKEELLPCSAVVTALGLKPLWDEADALRDCAAEFYQVGDCLRPGNLMAATGAAWTAARNIGCY
ncbi:MAG: FAD-dependent oxidoreductase, partial [Oscillospiraceae bacterium]|nr:FAD-dependent oxidoreductase [Oscillospiraceae bacterium]